MLCHFGCRAKWFSYREGNGTPLQCSFAWKIPWMEEPGRLVHGVAKSWTLLSNFTFTFHFHALEKEKATCSSVLVWRIPGTGEPGGLPSMGLHRVGHNWSDLAAAAAACTDLFFLKFFSHLGYYTILQIYVISRRWNVFHICPLISLMALFAHLCDDTCISLNTLYVVI